jgi:hypothetical protein
MANTRIVLDRQSDLMLTGATLSTPYISNPIGLVQADISGLTSSLASLEAKDTSLTTRVSAEESTRSSADNSLTSRISAEESTRSSADTSLTTRVSTEESVRASVDSSINTRLNNFSAGSLQAVTFSGSINGTNKTYTNTIDNLSSVSLSQVFLNGLLQDSDDYTISLGASTSELVFTEAPETGSKIAVLVFKAPVL